MSKIILTVSLFALSIANVSAMELLAYKDATTGVTRLADSAVEEIWAKDQPACLKDGAKLLGVNKAFKSAGLGYRDCSNSASTRIKANALGYQVTVIKLSELSDAKIKSVLGK